MTLRLLILGALWCLLFLQAPGTEDPVSHPFLSTRLTVEKVATVGDPSGPGAILHHSNRLGLLPDGRFAVLDYGTRGVVKIYSSAGAYQQSFGTFGVESGSYRNPVLPIWESDIGTLHMIDVANQRISAISPRDGTFISAIPFKHGEVPYSLVLPSYGIVISGAWTGDLSIGERFHVLNTSGAFVRSFGAPPGLVWTRSDPEGRRLSVLAASTDGHFWAAWPGEYLLDRWHVSGAQKATVRVDESWFPVQESLHYPQAPSDEAPSVRVAGVYEADPSRLVVGIRIPTERWQDEFAPDSSAPRGYAMPQPSDAVWSGRLDLVEVESGRVLSRIDVPHAIAEMLDDGRYYVRTADELGRPQIEVWKVALLSPQLEDL